MTPTSLKCLSSRTTPASSMGAGMQGNGLQDHRPLRVCACVPSRLLLARCSRLPFARRAGPAAAAARHPPRAAHLALFSCPACCGCCPRASACGLLPTSRSASALPAAACQARHGDPHGRLQAGPVAASGADACTGHRAGHSQVGGGWAGNGGATARQLVCLSGFRARQLVGVCVVSQHASSCVRFCVPHFVPMGCAAGSCTIDCCRGDPSAPDQVQVALLHPPATAGATPTPPTRRPSAHPLPAGRPSCE